jgi:hypothetical protein
MDTTGPSKGSSSGVGWDWTPVSSDVMNQWILYFLMDESYWLVSTGVVNRSFLLPGIRWQCEWMNPVQYYPAVLQAIMISSGVVNGLIFWPVSRGDCKWINPNGWYPVVCKLISPIGKCPVVRWICESYRPVSNRAVILWILSAGHPVVAVDPEAVNLAYLYRSLGTPATAGPVHHLDISLLHKTHIFIKHIFLNSLTYHHPGC